MRRLVVLSVLILATPGFAEMVTISDEGWGGARQVYDTCIFQPDTSPMTIAGSVELTGLPDNSAMMIGLVDKAAVDGYYLAQWLGSNAGGAWGYFGYRASTGNRLGASNGRVGGELIAGGVYRSHTDGGPNLFDFSVVIGNGNIAFANDTFSETIAYDAGDFASGQAYLVVDLWAPAGYAQYDLSSPSCAVVPVPGAILLGMLGLGTAGLRLRKRTTV